MSFISLSYIILWLLVMSLTLHVIVTSKKPGLILPASNTGLPIGATFPQFKISSVLEMVPFNIQHPKHTGALVLFTSLRCSICNSVYPMIPLVEKKYQLKAQVIMEPLEEDDVESIMTKINQLGLTFPIYKLTTSIKEEVKLHGFPFAYLLSPEGKVLSKGGINKIEDFDILVNQGRRIAFKMRKKLVG